MRTYRGDIFFLGRISRLSTRFQHRQNLLIVSVKRKKVLIYLEGPDIITTSHKLLNKCILKYLHAGKFHSCQHKSLSKIKVDFSKKYKEKLKK